MNERIISLAVWFASMVAAYFFPHVGTWLVLATTVNLLHYRFVDWYSGSSFRTRVMSVLDEALAEHDRRVSAMEKDVADIKESQNKIIQSFRTGRTLPG
jgi:hypothetical protein